MAIVDNSGERSTPTKRSIIRMVWAEDLNGVIGIGNDLPWHISEDLKRFQILTSESTVVMGAKTWLSLPKRPLPSRRNIVLSSRGLDLSGAEVVGSVDEVLNLGVPVWIIGGGSVYEQFLALAEELFVTQVLTAVDVSLAGEEVAYAPSLVNISKLFSVIDESTIMVDEKAGLSYRFIRFENKTKQ